VSVCSLEFLVCVMLGSAVFFWLPTVRLRQAALALANAGVLYVLIPNAESGFALGTVLISGYLVARLLQRRPKQSLLAGYIVLLVAAFLVLKQYEFLAYLLPAELLHHTLAVVGISYLLFRQIHVAVDALQGQIEHLSWWRYLNYQLNLFGLLAGPIQRYQDFQRDWDTLAPLAVDAHSILRNYIRMFVGVIKVAVIAWACLALYNSQITRLAEPATQLPASASLNLLAAFYLYPAYIYFNFSGYCDIVIAAAALFGIRMPENFDAPYLSRNMIEYWTRWHRTLGFWIRDYLFAPLYSTLAVRCPRFTPAVALVSYFVALFLTGVWHGSTWNFVLFGLLNGLGVAVVKLWENTLVSRFGRKGLRHYLESRPIRVAAICLTLHFVCLTIFFFPTDLERSLRAAYNVIAPQIGS